MNNRLQLKHPLKIFLIVISLMLTYPLNADAAFTKSFQDSARDQFISRVDTVRQDSVENIQEIDDIAIIVNQSELQEVAEGAAKEEWTSSFSRSMNYSIAHYTNFFADKESEKEETVSVYAPVISNQLRYGNFVLSSQLQTVFHEHDHFHKNDGFESRWDEYALWANKKSSLSVSNSYESSKFRSDSSEDKPVSVISNEFSIKWKHRLTAKTLYFSEFDYIENTYRSEVDKENNSRDYRYTLGLKYKVTPTINIAPEYSFEQHRVPKIGEDRSVDSHLISFKTAFFVTPKLHITLRPGFKFSHFQRDSIQTLGTKFRFVFNGGVGYRYSPKTTLSMVFGTGSISSGLISPDDADAMTIGFVTRYTPGKKIQIRSRNIIFASESGRFSAEPQNPSASFKPKTLIYRGALEATWDVMTNVSLNAKYIYEKRFADLELNERVSQSVLLDTFYKF